MLMLFRSIAVALAMNGCAHNGITEPKRAERLESLAARAVENGFPGIAIAYSPDRDVLETAAGGFADKANAIPMNAKTQFHAASTTKVVTAAAVLLLVDRKVLALDAKLPDLLPARIVGLVPHGRDISLRQLLTHRSGIYSPNNNLEYLSRYIGPDRLTKPFWTTEEIVAFASKSGNSPQFAPGEGQAYGDINYALLSLVVAEAAKGPFKSFVQTEIFAPAGMTESYYLSDGERTGRARGYIVDSQILREIGLDPALKADTDGLIDASGCDEKSDGAAGLITTAGDLVRFADAALRGNLLSPSARALLLSVADEAAGGGEALGVLRGYRLPFGVIVAAEGDGPGTNVIWAMKTDTGEIAVIATNLFGRWDENDYFKSVLLPEIFH